MTPESSEHAIAIGLTLLLVICQFVIATWTGMNLQFPTEGDQ